MFGVDSLVEGICNNTSYDTLQPLVRSRPPMLHSVCCDSASLRIAFHISHVCEELFEFRIYNDSDVTKLTTYVS